MNELAKFEQSSDQLKVFLCDWIKCLDEKCEKADDKQLKASYYIWARYSMSIRTLRHICKPEFLPDLCVIARGCLEFSASLQAVLSDEQAANDYLEFEKHAKSRYLRLVDEADSGKISQFRQHLSELGVEDPDGYKWNKWCVRSGGITKLIEKHIPAGPRLYFFLSDFAHGSVTAIRILQNATPGAPALLEKLIEGVYPDYLIVTVDFLDKAWGTIITEDGERCKNEFNGVLQLFC